ncbi:MAG: DUF1905 domain-containing protein [Bacteroidota bacterium]
MPSKPTKKKSAQSASGKNAEFTSVLERSDNKLWGGHFEVPARVAKNMIDGSSRRVVCTLNDSVEYQCALLPHGNGTFVITVNKKLRDALHLLYGMPVEVRLRKDESKYGLPMPEELEELLRQDKEGARLMHSLTPGKLRTLLYIIGGVKNPAARASRSVVIVQHLKSNKGKINYRQLNESMRKR